MASQGFDYTLRDQSVALTIEQHDQSNIITRDELVEVIDALLRVFGQAALAMNIQCILDGLLMFFANEGTTELLRPELRVGITFPNPPGGPPVNVVRTWGEIEKVFHGEITPRRFARRLADYTRDLLIQSGRRTRIAEKYLVPHKDQHLAFDFADACTKINHTDRYKISLWKNEALRTNKVVVPRGDALAQVALYGVPAPFPQVSTQPGTALM